MRSMKKRIGYASAIALGAAIALPASAMDHAANESDQRPGTSAHQQMEAQSPDAATSAPDAATSEQERMTDQMDRRAREAEKVPMEQQTQSDDPSAEEYVVEKGDTLGDIAREKLGDVSEWKRIAKLNDIDDPTRLEVGTRLKIPAN